MKPYVRDFAFTADGKWLLTTSKQRRVEGPPLEKLKFWSWSDEQQAYLLNSVMEQPHTVEMASLAVHPTRHVALTTARDGSFSLWSVKVLLSFFFLPLFHCSHTLFFTLYPPTPSRCLLRPPFPSLSENRSIPQRARFVQRSAPFSSVVVLCDWFGRHRGPC